MNVLGLFVKHPVPGRVKTRLAETLGSERAAALYAAFTADLVARFRTAADRRFLCYAPDEETAHAHFRELANADYLLWAQPERELGERMRAFFDDAFNRGAERVVIVGSDSPTLPADFIEEAFRHLETRDCVLGPAADGGYYLIGQRGASRPIFDGVEWSRATVLERTTERLAGCGVQPAVLQPWYDVDTLDDLYLLRGHVRAMRMTGLPFELERTEPLLAGL